MLTSAIFSALLQVMSAIVPQVASKQHAMVLETGFLSI